MTPFDKFNKLKSVFQKSPSPSLKSNPNSQMASPILSAFDEPPLTPLEIKGYKSSTKHQLLSTELAEDIRQHIPSLLQISHTWTLLYSLEQNGTSLNTLYNNCAPKIGENNSRRKGFLLIVLDGNKDLFGAYLSDYPRPLDGRYYYGNGDCFLWKAENGNIKKLSRGERKENDQDNNMEDNALQLKVFPYTSLNDFIIYSNHDFISVGSGNGKFGLWIDGNFETGASDFVETFGNEPLSKTKKFNILGLEVWRIQ